MDKDLEFLNGCSNEQLQMLADSIAFDDKGKQRPHESLTTRKNYKLHYPNEMKKLLPDIVDELSLYGGNSIRNRIVGHGASYRNILEDVCDKYKVKYNDFNSVDEIEGFLLKKVLLVAAEDMSTEDVKHISERLNTKEDLNNVIRAGKIASPIIIRMTTVLVYRMFSRLGAKVAARFIVRFAGSRLFAILTGPTGWVIGGLWTAYDLLGPSYKVTVPCTILIAYYRILSQKTEGELKEILG
jgi:uncharacterized protein YaaW (UPF0174 family)